MQCVPFPKSTVFGQNNFLTTSDTRYGYEVLGMILFQAYPYIYRLLRGVTFHILLLSSYVHNLTMLPLLETFLHLLW